MRALIGGAVWLGAVSVCFLCNDDFLPVLNEDPVFDPGAEPPTSSPNSSETMYEPGDSVYV